MYHFYSLPKIVSNYVRKRPPALPEWLLSVGLQGCGEVLLAEGEEGGFSLRGTQQTLGLCSR